MAANIEVRTVNGVEIASFAENGRKERAWHRLGQVYDKPMTAVEALQNAHADFEVEGRSMYFPTPEFEELMAKGEPVPPMALMQALRKVDGYKANVRTDYNEALGVVSESYGIVQNKHAFDFVDVLTTGKLGGETPTIDCAGVLGHGERIFITAKFPEPIRVGKNSDDIIDMNIVFTTSHDGSGAVVTLLTPVRVVCENTLNLSFSNNKGKFSTRHTSHIMDRLDLSVKDNASRAYQALNLYNVYKEHFEGTLAQLGKMYVDDKEIENVLVHSLLADNVISIYDKTKNIHHEDIPTRSQNIITNVTDALHTGIGQDILERGTGLWFVNGLTTYYQNNKEWKDEEKKFDAIVGGSVQKKLQKAYDLLAYKIAA